jgi:hypothetical protein
MYKINQVAPNFCRSVYTSNTVEVLYEAGTCLPFVSTWVHPSFLWVRIAHLFSFLCRFFMSSSCVLCTQCCQCISRGVFRLTSTPVYSVNKTSLHDIAKYILTNGYTTMNSVTFETFLRVQTASVPSSNKSYVFDVTILHVTLPVGNLAVTK